MTKFLPSKCNFAILSASFWLYYETSSIMTYCSFQNVFRDGFFANKKLIITLRTWKFGDVT